MSEILEIRKGSDLTSSEKDIIIQAMLSAGSNKSAIRTQLALDYTISEGSINSLLAHETMRRQREIEGDIVIITPEDIQGDIQTKVYAITSISGLTDIMRDNISSEFTDIVNEHVGEIKYDYYEDIGALSEYYDVDPIILEQYLRNRFKWLGASLDILKKNENIDKLTYEDKINIREYVESGINKEEKKKRRKEMSLKYGVSIYTIGAITAWKKGEDGNITLGEKNIAETTTISDERPTKAEGVFEISEVTKSETIQPTETNSALEHINNDNNIEDILDEVIDRDFILELVQSFNLEDESERQEFVEYVFDCFPDATIEDIKRIITDFPDDITHKNEKRSGEGMGALVEYNNEIKNKWRQKLKDFIDENTDIAKRKDMKVLCLPGLKCLEIPLYLELGFQPENIVGVEAGIVKGKKDPELIRQFEENAARYGIQTRIGKLEKILETEETTFDVVSLDFLGYVNREEMAILERIKINRKAIVTINYLAKRENLGGKGVIAIGNMIANRSKNGKFNGSMGITVESLETIGNRDTGIPNIIEQFIGCSKIESKWFLHDVGLKGKTTLEEFGNEYERLLKLGLITKEWEDSLLDKSRVVIKHYREKLIKKITIDLIGILKDDQEIRQEIRRFIGGPLTRLFYNIPSVKKIKQYKYLSKTGKKSGGSPFFSEFLVIKRYEEVMEKCGLYLDFFAEYLALAIKNQGKINFGIETIVGKGLFLYLKKSAGMSKRRVNFDEISKILLENHKEIYHTSILEREINNTETSIREIIN